MIASIRTNAFFVTIFFGLFMTFVLLTGSEWEMAQSHMAAGMNCDIAAGAFAFIACLCGWYLFLVQMLESVDFPLNLPVFDLSTMVKGEIERRKAKEEYSA